MSILDLKNLLEFSEEDRLMLIKVFCDNVERDIIPKMEKAIMEGDNEKLIKVKHELDGVAKNIGSNLIINISENIKRTREMGKIDELKGVLKKIREY